MVQIPYEYYIELRNKETEFSILKGRYDDLVKQIEELTEQRDIASANSDKFYKDARERHEELCELQKRYGKLDDAYDNLVDENYGLTCERDGVKRTCEAKDYYISILQTQISDLVERNKELNDRLQGAIKARNIAMEEMDNLRKELKSALEALHDQYDDSDKPCCKDCVFCRPVKGCNQPAFYCSKTAEYLYNNYAETYYCKEMIPYEDDYPF